MNLAHARECHDLRLLLASPSEGGRPFASALQRIHLLANVNHAAIDQTRHKRRELPWGGPDHCLVEQSEAMRDASLPKARFALKMQRTSDEFRLATSRPNSGCIGAVTYAPL